MADSCEGDRMFPERIETDRLHLERISAETVDLFDLDELYSDGDDVEEMFEYWDSSPHETVKETSDYIEEAERWWVEAEGAKYVIRPREGEDGAGVIAGTTGLYPDWEKRSADLGILLDKQFWGRDTRANEPTRCFRSRSSGSTSTSWWPPMSMATSDPAERSRSTSNGMAVSTRGCSGTGIRCPTPWLMCTGTPSPETSISRRSSVEARFGQS